MGGVCKDVEGPIPADGTSLPFGAAHVPALGLGTDLAAHGYVESEYLVGGTADVYAYDDRQRATVADPRRAYRTRIVVRRPADPAAASGTAWVEPLHPLLDTDFAWRQVHPYLIGHGDLWVGVSIHAATAALLRTTLDPARYAALDLPVDGLGWDILRDVGALLRRTGPDAVTGGVRVRRVFMTGRSATGTVCRVFLGSGFHEAARLPDGKPVFDGYLIGISSGAFGPGGYTPLSPASGTVPPDDPRRTIQPHGVPVFEVLSETESETHKAALRNDSDEPSDPYRLYEVAGACHTTPGTGRGAEVQSAQARAAGVPVPATAIVETPSDFRMDRVMALAHDHLHRWVADGTVPPRADRLRLAEHRDDGPCGTAVEALPLLRDDHGNALGGVRSTQVDVPTATYVPHSTIAGDAPQARLSRRPHAPGSIDLGDLNGHMVPFPLDKLAALYPTRDDYVRRVAARADALVAEGWLLPADAARAKADAAARAWP